MKKFLFALALALFTTSALADIRYLHYQYNRNVRITISNVECAIVSIKHQYDYMVVATRIDGERLIGCYKKKTEDLLEIQWYKGDKTVLPANAFLLKPEQAETIKPEL